MFFPFPKPTLISTFLNRPQRFLAEVALKDGTPLIAYCPNPGSFGDCLVSGSPCLLWDSKDDKRKRRYTLRAVKKGKTWIGTDTHLANGLVLEAIKQGMVPSLGGYQIVQSEPAGRAQRRLDFLLKHPKRGESILEVKSATIAVKGVAQFPDSRSPRAIQHVKALIQETKKGRRALLVFLVQRGDVRGFRVNTVCDEAFSRAISLAAKAGVELLALRVTVNPQGFRQPKLISVLLD